MKRIKKCIVVSMLFLLLGGAISEVRALGKIEINRNKNDITSIKGESILNNKSDDKPKCKYKEGEVIVTYEQSFCNKMVNLTLDSMFNSYKVAETSEFQDIRIESDKTVSIASSDSQATNLAISLVKSDKHSTQELIDIFKNKDWIISAEPNYIIKSTSLTNDEYEKYQWGLENTGQNSGTKELDINPVYTSSENEKVIAVIDSGVDYTHEDLKNIMWNNPYSDSELKGKHGYNFVDNNTDIMDDMYHGTHVAGIIAAESNNEAGISGGTLGASNIKIMALKVTDVYGTIGDIFSVIQAYNYIYKAQQLGTNVVAINNSWGSYLQVEDDKEYMNSLVSAINLVGEKGALSICAAGNESADLGKDGLEYLDLETVDENGETIYDEYGNPITKNVLCKSFPGCLDSEYIINVAASDEKDELATFSNYGESVDIAAPGTNILSTIPNKIYGSANAGFDKRMFLPSIYDDEKRAKVCEQYWDFENNTINDIPFTVNMGTLSIAENKSFGKGKKSLKWEFTLNGNEEIFPELKLGNNYINNDYFSCMITAEIDGDDAYIITGCKWKDENDEEMITVQGDDVFSGNSNYWSKFGNPVWKFEGQESMNEIYVQVRNLVRFQRGNYTIYIDDFGVSKPCSDEDVRVPYTFKYGTSMAAPYVTGAVGTLSNLYENDTALQLKDKLLSCKRKSTNLNGKVATGGVLDLSSAIIHTTGITLDKTSAEIIVGENLQLTPKITPEDATNKNVIWTSSNPNIATVENGKITALAEGSTTITVTTKDGEFQASCNVIVYKVKLSSIEIANPPTKTQYLEGQNFDTSGMKITATYNDGTEKEITDYTVTDGNNLTTNKTSVTISYTENDVTKTVTQAITVSQKALSSIKILTPPSKTTYIEGQNFDATGMKVTATYNDDTEKEITDYTVTDGNNLTTDKTSVTISYTENGITKKTTQAITVTKKLEISFIGYSEVNQDDIKFIDNIGPCTTMKEMINNVKTNGTITVYKDDREVTDNNIKISTGMKVKISLNNENYEFKVVVKGDTNGDGESNLKDLLQINKHRLNKTKLTAEYLLAGDVNKDNEVNLRDLLQVNKYRLGKIKTF